MTPDESVDKLLCIQCGHLCCKKHYFFFPYIPAEETELLAAKGIDVKVALLGNGKLLYRVSVPYVCQHLEEGVGCRIYGERPQGCREYDGKCDPDEELRAKCRLV